MLQMDTARLIYAYGMTDPLNNVLTPLDYHNKHARGTKSIHLFDSASPMVDVPEDALRYDLLNEEVRAHKSCLQFITRSRSQLLLMTENLC